MIASTLGFRNQNMRMISTIGVFCGMILIPTHLVAIESQVYYIAMEGSAPYYSPSLATVPADFAVQWINQTATAHTATHDGCLRGKPCAFDSGSVLPGKSFPLPTLKVGTYHYYCRIHPIMRGVVTVTELPLKKKVLPYQDRLL